MGKGQRNREQKKAAAAPRRRAVPEMLPNTPDSLNDVPRPGQLSEHGRDFLEPDVNAWSLLNMYLGVIMDLEASIQGFDDVDDEAVAGQVAEQLRELHPAEFAGTERNVAEFTAAMKPRWRGRVTNVIFGEVSKWLAETGYQPDRRAWFTGAQAFVSVTVPAQHRAATLALLDYDTLVAETERINADRATPVPQFDLDKPVNSVWYALAMRAYPLAMVHAAAALAAWLHAQPGAVTNVHDKRRELGERALKFLEIVVRAPRRDLAEPEEPEPPYVAPWEGQPEPAPALATGELVDVTYAGPPITPWIATYLWAAMLTTLANYRHGGPFGEVPDPGDSPTRALLARAISIYSRRTGLTGDLPAPGPGALNPMSLPQLALQHLNPAVAIVQFMQVDLGHHPVPGELGYQAYMQVYETIRAGGVTAEEVLADAKLAAELNHNAQALIGEARNAEGIIRHAIQLAVPDVPGAPIPNDVLLGQLGGYLNDYLNRTPIPDDNTEFRLLVEQQVGWPGGKPPSGLITSPGPWYRLSFTPSTEPGGEKGLAWCRWLLRQGWAIESHPDAEHSPVWLALPNPYANDLWMATQHYMFRTSTVLAWTKLGNVDSDTPSAEFLREHYGPPPPDQPT